MVNATQPSRRTRAEAPGIVPAPAAQYPPSTAGLDQVAYRTAAEAALEATSPAAHRVGWGFISLYMLAYMSTCLVFLAHCW